MLKSVGSNVSSLEVESGGKDLDPAAELRRSVVNRKSLVQRITDIETEVEKQDAPIKQLRVTMLSDQHLFLEYLMAIALTIALAFAFAITPQFVALMVQTVLNANDGMSNVEKALLWETTFLIMVFSLGGLRSSIISRIQRRIQFRIDVGLTTLAEKASRGEIPTRAGRDAAEANSERVSKPTAWVLVQSRLDMLLFGGAAVLCVIYLTFFLSWKMGLALLITLSIGFGLSYYRSHIGRVLNELEMQLSRLVGEEEQADVGGPTPKGKNLDIPEATEPGAVSYMTAELLAKQGNMDNLSRAGALHDVMALESEYSSKHEAVLGVQVFIVFFASLVGIYVGAQRVIQERNKYTPEELIERLFYFLATLGAAKECQTVLWRLENTLPELRIIAKLHSQYTLVSQELIDMMAKKHLLLKGTPNKVIALMSILCVVMFAWLGYLVAAGGGYGCETIPAICSANPAGSSGPITFGMDQRFSLVGGGCVLQDTHNVMLKSCARQVFAVQRNAGPNDKSKARRLAAHAVKADSRPIKRGMRVDCPEDDVAPYVVDPGTMLRVGEIQTKEGNEITCEVFKNVWGTANKATLDIFPRIITVDDEEGCKAYSVKINNPVSPEVLSRGTQTEMTVRLQYIDWSGAPAFFEGIMENEDADPVKKRRLEEGATKEKEPLVMKGKVARDQNVFQSKLRVHVQIPKEGGCKANHDTLSLELFMGIECRNTEASDCTQRSVMPLTVLGSDWKPGMSYDIDIDVPTQMPNVAKPCSAAMPKDCIGSAVLASSGRAGFMASFTIAVLDDGNEGTTEDPTVVTAFVMDSMHRCEGLHETGTLDCTLQIEPQLTDTDLRLPGELSCTGPKWRECENSDKEPIGSSNGLYYSDTLFSHLKYKHPADPKTQGTAEWHVWVNKETNSAVRFSYHASKDCGCYPDHETFTLDFTLDDQVDAQQTSSRRYPKYCLKPSRNFQPWNTNGLSLEQIPLDCKTPLAYTRGQLVPAKHLSQNLDAVEASGYMTNVLPMVYTMEQEAWRATEELIDCNRDEVPLSVIGGAVFLDTGLGKDMIGFNGNGLDGKWKGDANLKERRRWHWKTHEVETPTYMWKLVMPQEATPGFDPIAFWIPNTEHATRANLPEFVVSVKQLEELLKIHGKMPNEEEVNGIKQRLTVAETFEVDEFYDKAKRVDLNDELTPWVKNIKNCRKAAPEERWKREFCRLRKIPMPKCLFEIDEEEFHCYKLTQLTGVKARWADQDPQCKSFKKDKDRILADLAKPPMGKKIGESAKKCEVAVKRVCRENLCPTYKTIMEKDDLDCNAECHQATKTAFNTGSIPCDIKKETFGDCLDNMHKNLIKAGRNPALEALIRELTVKCICVSSKEDSLICYEGSMGIPKDSKWCEFDGTPSWLNLLKKKKEGFVPTTPTCNVKEL